MSLHTIWTVMCIAILMSYIDIPVTICRLYRHLAICIVYRVYQFMYRIPCISYVSYSVYINICSVYSVYNYLYRMSCISLYVSYTVYHMNRIPSISLCVSYRVYHMYPIPCISYVSYAVYIICTVYRVYHMSPISYVSYAVYIICTVYRVYQHIRLGTTDE